MTLKNLSAVALAGAGMLAQGQSGTTNAHAPASVMQASPVPTVTSVMVIVTAKPGTEREDVMKVIPQEVRATVKLYLDGKIEQWFSRGDGRGVVLFVRAKTVEEARGIVDTLPLHATGLMEEQYVPVGPLVPLRALLAAQQSSGDGAGH